MKINNLIELAKHFEKRETCIEYLKAIRWNDGEATCVFCNENKVTELNGKNRRYKCRSCNKQFSITKGTIFENSPISLQKWFMAVYLITSHKKGISSIQLGKDIGVTQKTAWFMSHRIRFALSMKSFEKMDGIIQCDETYIGGKEKNKPKYKRTPNAQGRSLKSKTPVFGMMHQMGSVSASVVPDTKAKTIKPIIERMVSEGSIIVTDEWKAYQNLPKKYKHVVLKHTEEEYVRGAFHTNTIEGFWSLFKRGIYGIYHQINAKHLNRYCDEFSFRYNTRKLTEIDRFEKMMSKMNRRITYENLISD